MMLLVTCCVAVLALWLLRRVLIQRAVLAPSRVQAPGPDSLYFETRTGAVIAAGARVSQLLGYRRAADCLAQFDGARHFKNASLVQLISGQVKPAALVLQTADGQALAGNVGIRVIEGVGAVEVQAAVKVERRASQLKSLPAELATLPMPSPFEPGPLFSVLAASHAGDEPETYHAVFDLKSLRLQPSPGLCHRIGFPVGKRWLTLALWRRCLDPDDHRGVLHCLTRQPAGDPAPCRVATLTGELLSLHLTVIALPEPWGSHRAGVKGEGGVGLLKIQVEQPARQEPSLTAQSQQWAAVDGVRSPGDNPLSAPPLPGLGSKGSGRNAQNKRAATVKRVLLIEDDRVVRQALLPILTEAGLAITTAASLDLGVNLWRTETYDLVITDRNLGRDSILPLLDEMAFEGSTVPVLLMTAEPFDHPAVYATLAKPFDLAAFQGFLKGGLRAIQAGKGGTEEVAP